MEFFAKNEGNKNKFLELLKDLQFIDAENHYAYSGELVNFAALFKALYDFSLGDGQSIIKTTTKIKPLCRMLESEFPGLEKSYETFKKAFSKTGTQTIDNDSEKYLYYYSELEGYFS